MSAEAKTSSLRDAHKDLTQARILEAALDLLCREDLEQLTVAGVAAEAGVTERTVYRHFATREDLLAAVWPALQKRVQSPGFASTAHDVAAMPLWLFPNFDKEAGAVRASAFSKAGREVRMRVNDTRRKAFVDAVRDARPDLKGDELTRLAAVVQVINSAFAWAVMRDFWGLDGAESGRAASEAIIKLLGLNPADIHVQTQKSKRE